MTSEVERFIIEENRATILKAAAMKGGIPQESLNKFVSEHTLELFTNKGLITKEEGIIKLTKKGQAEYNSIKLEREKQSYDDGDKFLVKGSFSPRPITLKIAEKYEGLGYDPVTQTVEAKNKIGVFEDIESQIEKDIRLRYLADETIKKNYVDEVLADIKGCYSRNRPSPAPWYIIKFVNGVYDAKEGKFYTNDEAEKFDYFFINYIPHEYNAELKDCPTIDTLLTEWSSPELPYDFKIELEEEASTIPLRKMVKQKLFIWKGRGGNGKGVAAKLLQRTWGEQNTTAVSIGELADNKYAPGFLYNKLLNISSELNLRTLERTDMIKKLVAEDILTCDRKYKEPFTYESHATIFVLTNILPQFEDRTDGTNRRIKILDWLNVFEGKGARFDIVDQIPEPEIQAWINRLLRILTDLFKRNFIFTYEPTTEQTRNLVESLSNPVVTFLTLCTQDTEDNDVLMPRWVFREVLNRYLHKNGERTLSDKEIGSEMDSYTQRQVTFSPEYVRKWNEALNKEIGDDLPEKRWFCYVGLKLTTKVAKDDIIKFNIYETLYKHALLPLHPLQGDRKKMILDYLRKNKGETLTTIQVNLNIEPEIVKKDIEQFLDDGLLYRDKAGNLFTKDTGAAL